MFGKVVENLALVPKIARVKRDRQDKPLEDVIIEEILITEEN